MLTVKNGSVKHNNGKVVVGFDLGDNFSQVSFFGMSANEPETVSAVTGTEMYNIPTVLSKRPGIGQWHYGREAIKHGKEDGIVIKGLLEAAVRGEDVLVDGEEFDPIALLALFVKRCLGLLYFHVSPKNVEAYMFTVETLDTRTVEVLNRMVAYLNLENSKISFVSHVESFYHYMIHQPRELWKYHVLVLEYNDSLKYMRFECASHTTPQVVFIHSGENTSIEKQIWPTEENEKNDSMAEFDMFFANEVSKILSEGDFTTVYLLGDGFKDTWAKESLQVICKNRRVFQGNNLYSKGACFGMMDRLKPNEISSGHVFLGEDKVKSNVGMRVERRGEESYFALLDAGSNWYEVESDFDLILEEGNEIGFVITSLTGGNVTEKSLVLDGLAQRPKGTTRLRIHIEMSKVDALCVEIEDLGFGEIVKSSGRAWTQTIDL